MYRVKRAIIMAAGIGKRLQPITFVTPKSMIKVNEVRMIETIIQGLHANGIQEIYVVVGYLKENFNCLKEQYEGLKLIDNPYYKTCNNISSLYMAREYIEDVIILDGDQIIYNNSVLEPYFERSGYNAVWTEEKTDEWLMTVENGIVTHCSRTGGNRGWKLYSISRWSTEDGRKLQQHLELVFRKDNNHQLYWDDVALFCYPQEYALGIREMKPDDVIEVDSLRDLVRLDQTYLRYLK